MSLLLFLCTLEDTSGAADKYDTNYDATGEASHVYERGGQLARSRGGPFITVKLAYHKKRYKKGTQFDGFT